MTQKQLKKQRAEEVQDYFTSKQIHKALAGQLKPSDTEIIQKLRKESKRYETIQFRLQAN